MGKEKCEYCDNPGTIIAWICVYDNGYPQRAGDYVCRSCFDKNGLNRVNMNWNSDTKSWDDGPLPLV